ncbi:hypothetical protein P3T73_03785 [Kiritimatiellota bacterium B12222]|nr:hypothetical protein P3T73_03785 [Kiritimatiellota bacterium B12222]
MKKLYLLTIFLLCSLPLIADSSLSAYASYMNTDSAGEGSGYGGRLKSTFLSVGSIEIHGGNVEMDDSDTTLYPFDISLNLRLPFMISPYAGVGVGYTLVDSTRPSYEDMKTLYAQLGLEITFVWFGLMAEVRAQDAENNDFDGVTGNIGIMLKW